MNMFVSNLTKGRLGINGVINLAPEEVNRAIEVTEDLLRRVKALSAAHLVSFTTEEGLTKKGIAGKVVGTVGIDEGALSDGPRTGAKVAKEDVKENTENVEVKVEEAKEVNAEEVKTEEAATEPVEKAAKETTKKGKKASK